MNLVQCGESISTMTFKLRLASVFANPNCLLGRRNRHQFLVTLLLNIATFSHGLGVGWMSPVMRDLQTDESPLDFPVLVSQVSWIGSLVGIGSVMGNLIAGLLMDRIGRKMVLFFIAIPYTTFWCLVYFVQSVEFLYIGRLMAGVTGGACYVVLPTFISEIADTNVRGRLGSIILLSVNTGVLAGYIVSTRVDYFTSPPFIIALPVCYFICNFLIPETPHHLVRKGKFEAAKRSFMFYKNIRKDDIKAEDEFEEMKYLLIKEQTEKAKSFDYRDFITKPAFKAYASAAVLLISNQFSASFCVTTYLADVFAASYTTLNLGMCTIVIGVLQIVGNYVTTLLCDKYGRRILMLTSTLGASLCLTAFGTFTFFAKTANLSAVDWLPLVILSCFVFLCNIGLVGCLFVVLVELFPAKIRSAGVSTFVVILSSTVFLTLKIFPICMAVWGTSVTMWCCSGITFLSFLYFCFFLEETNGKSLLEA
ncbi:facilitated trehalose transporter Tret1 [Drosophila mauritiana]|uniref:Facilitated trehalose transporter Tret1 n=1 Tax=Drosophila mauritiana TaxID=7226 RepID=A0A6P8JV91_DROMA|nr:facilitated trehalose transporter Tret1 [Drosophila mauritiana]